MAKRDNGAGTIRTVRGANGTRYYAYAPAKYEEQPDGTVKCVRLALGWRSKKTEAKALLDEFKQHPTSKYNYTLEMVYDAWMPAAFAEIGKDTQNNYTAAWQQIRWAKPELLNVPMREITTDQIREIYTYWLEQHIHTVRNPSGTTRQKKVGPLSKSSLQKIKALLTQLYTYAESNNITAKNYAKLVRLPKDAEEGEGRPLSDAEFEILRKHWQDVPGGDSVFALCYLGFRVTEFCLLKPSDYDEAAHTITGGIKTEAGKGRVVPVHPVIRPIVERWVAAAGERLYQREDGLPYNKDTYRTMVFAPVLAAIGLPDDLTPHSARKTCATRMSAAGLRDEDIIAIMGHADFEITKKKYIKQDPKTLTAAMGLLD